MPPPSANSALTPDPALVARFRADLAAVAGSGKVVVATSGGPDSVALLLLTRAAIGEQCTVATVDHGIRAESAAEASWVAELCERLRVGHATLTAPLPLRVGHTANLSARARALRYRLLEDHRQRVGADAIATAHHADDQVETLVMRLNRGAGVSGLAGIRRRGGRIVRPLLSWRRHELATIVMAAGLTAMDDPSNRDERYDRARLRRQLAMADWIDPLAVSSSARALDDADRALEWMTAHLEKHFSEPLADTGVSLWPGDFPFEVKRRLVARCLHRVDPELEIAGPALARMVAGLEAGKGSTLGRVVARLGRNSAGGIVWTFRPAPPRRSA